MKLDSYFTSHTKINAKWIAVLNIRTKTIKFLGNIGENIRDIGFGNNFLEMIPKEKMNYIKIKNFCAPE